MKHIGIVMSAGKGLRIGGDIPKQYMDLCGMPVICHALLAMQNSFIDEIILVCGKGDEEYVKANIVDKYGFNKVTTIVEGGAERSDSVYNGLLKVSDPENSYVYIHDGARPMLNDTILNCVKSDVEKYGAVIAAVQSKDTVKIINEDGYVETTPQRDFVINVQTPQAFICSELLACYRKLNENKCVKVTDDSSVMELFGTRKVRVSKGDYCNIKITTKEDFITAEKFLQKK